VWVCVSFFFVATIFFCEERNLLGLETMHVTEKLTFSKGLSLREEHLLYLRFSLRRAYQKQLDKMDGLTDI
jgi:hypothetical protein